MNTATKFDIRLDIMGRSMDVPPHLVDAAVYVHDTLELALFAAEDIFGGGPTSEEVFGVYDRIKLMHDELRERRKIEADKLLELQNAG